MMKLSCDRLSEMKGIRQIVGTGEIGIRHWKQSIHTLTWAVFNRTSIRLQNTLVRHHQNNLKKAQLHVNEICTIPGQNDDGKALWSRAMKTKALNGTEIPYAPQAWIRAMAVIQNSAAKWLTKLGMTARATGLRNEHNTY